MQSDDKGILEIPLHFGNMKTVYRIGASATRLEFFVLVNWARFRRNPDYKPYDIYYLAKRRIFSDDRTLISTIDLCGDHLIATLEKENKKIGDKDIYLGGAYIHKRASLTKLYIGSSTYIYTTVAMELSPKELVGMIYSNKRFDLLPILLLSMGTKIYYPPEYFPLHQNAFHYFLYPPTFDILLGSGNQLEVNFSEEKFNHICELILSGAKLKGANHDQEYVDLSGKSVPLGNFSYNTTGCQLLATIGMITPALFNADEKKLADEEKTLQKKAWHFIQSIHQDMFNSIASDYEFFLIPTLRQIVFEYSFDKIDYKSIDQSLFNMVLGKTEAGNMFLLWKIALHSYLRPMLNYLRDKQPDESDFGLSELIKRLEDPPYLSFDSTHPLSITGAIYQHIKHYLAKTGESLDEKNKGFQPLKNIMGEDNLKNSIAAGRKIHLIYNSILTSYPITPTEYKEKNTVRVSLPLEELIKKPALTAVL